MKNTLWLSLTLLLFSCTKMDVTDMSSISEASASNKSTLVLSEMWCDGDLLLKNYFENGKLVRVDKHGFDLFYDYSNVDHFAVQTGDYHYQNFYYNDKHQVTRVDHVVGEGLVWVRHEFTYRKDFLAEHKWISYYTQGNYSEVVFTYEYKNQWNFSIKETSYWYQNGTLLNKEYLGSHFYRWHTPFELGTYVDLNSEPLYREVFSKKIKSPGYNSVTFPYGYYGFDENTKRDLMNLKAKVFNCPQSSGMLQTAYWERELGSERLVWELKNIDANREELPVSYDQYYYISGSNTPLISHFVCKYVSL